MPLPAARADAPALRAVPPDPCPLGGDPASLLLRILWVEDNADDVLLWRRRLGDASGAGFALTRVGTLAQALARLEDDAFDIVLLDVCLPDSAGTEGLARLRKAAPGMPVVAFTGMEDEDIALEILRAGADDYVVKERSDAAQLLRAIRYARERRASAEALHRSQEQLRQAQKMETIGRLAGGIAHDFNNLLTVIAGNSHVALSRLRPGDPLRGPIEEIGKAADWAGALVRQLLAFSRKQPVRPRRLDLNGAIREMDGMLHRLLGDDVDLATLLDGRALPVHIDPGQLEQLILNLAVNARDAMPGGGRLSIETSATDLDGAAAVWHGLPPGPYVRLAVRDGGTGMDDETRSHLFEPFYTTKDPGKGTGLGLSTVFGIVSQSGGHIEVRSAPGQGTVFEILLPREAAVDGPGAPAPAGPPQTAGGGTILLVEDQPLVRRLVRDSLRAGGYTVMEAHDGAEALRIWTPAADIRLLVTDVMMPGMSGPALAARLARRRPDLRVLYMSGYTGPDGAPSDVDSRSDFLPKPFTPDILLQKVREIL